MIAPPASLLQLAKQYPWIAGRTGSDRNIKLGSEIMTQMDKLRSDIAELKSKTEYNRRDAEKWRCEMHRHSSDRYLVPSPHSF